MQKTAKRSATSKDSGGGLVNIPDHAQITWYYHRVEPLQQAQKDCESTGGRWQNR
ncbi:hypothetical protein LOY64_14675 [Pseudomonas corrugata]|uniref:Uncharacterized protein n=1 Tax=Pseudomonas corrugata TaxID=47879 RepID=A0A8B6UXY0_9PSED|nr:hypothetical protein [Pseudomonas corrugata]MDU9022948.1 hypothetical protein [Pseudomonas corrugata]QTH16757.1 hypothetical protein C4C32_12960 [Pseudomonas corrugata]UZD98177.1 hypothetical protein LOY64_14675 [Pseudomonas corrugata]UZE08635.1 hypothetical protein LOY65_12205 [Pseudomonas corrugata]